MFNQHINIHVQQYMREEFDWLCTYSRYQVCDNDCSVEWNSSLRLLAEMVPSQKKIVNHGSALQLWGPLKNFFGTE